MDNKKILIVCKSFYPDNSPRSFRATELAKELIKQGHLVTVLMAGNDFDYSEFISKHNLTITNYGRLVLKPLEKSKWKWIGDNKRKFGRLLYMLFNYPDIEIMFRLKKALKKQSGYDLMISIAVPYPVHWGTAWARTKRHLIANTWVADCGDPFMGNKLESFRFPFYFAWLEKWFCRKADFISVPVEGAKHGYYKEFHSKIKIIPQGINFDEVEISHEKTAHPFPIFAYAGGLSFSGIRNPLFFMKYLIECNTDFEFHIYSSSSKAFLSSTIQESKGKIILHEAIPRTDLILELSKMDFLVNLDNGTSLQVPSKLIDYALT